MEINYGSLEEEDGSVAKPDDKGTYNFQDWLTWEGSWELINGKAFNMSPVPTSSHQFIVGELYFSLRTFFQNRKCFVFVAPFDVYFSENEQYDVQIKLYNLAYRWCARKTRFPKVAATVHLL